MGLSGRSVERSLRESTTFAWLVRGALVGYGLLHLLIGAVSVALVAHGHQPTSKGALERLSREPYGVPVLAALAIGFAVLAVWQAAAALVGYRFDEGRQRVLMRLGAACRVVTYGYLCFSLARLLRGDSGGSSARKASAGVLAEPFGRVLLGVGGLVVAGVGIGLAVFGLRSGFMNQLDQEARRSERRIPIVVVGQVGYVAKGVAFVGIGILLVWAAATDDPHRAGGLDQALARLVRLPLGAVAVIAIGLGIACFGLYLFARARHLARRTLTS
jgi:hypothetical protein